MYFLKVAAKANKFLISSEMEPIALFHLLIVYLISQAAASSTVTVCDGGSVLVNQASSLLHGKQTP